MHPTYTQYIRQMLTAIKGEIDSNTIIVGDFNTPLSPMDRSSKMKINKETQAINDTLNKMVLIDNYRIFHPKATEKTFFSSVLGIFSRIGHILGHKSSLGKVKKIEIISNIFSYHNSMRLDINYRKKTAKNTNTWRLNNTLLNNQEVTEDIKEEIKKYLETNGKENTMTQNLWDAAKAVLRGKFIAIQPASRNKKNSNKQLNLTPKAIRERRTKKPES